MAVTARQNKNPVQFNRSTRGDRVVGMTSGRAGLVLPIDYIPLLRGDSASGSFMAQVELAEMPKPLDNAVQVQFQAWFVPKPVHPQFAGYDEFLHSYQGEPIKALGQADRNPPPFFNQAASPTNFQNSQFLKTMGIHATSMGVGGRSYNTDLVDAYNLVWNFRAAAHSSRINRRPYITEDQAGATQFAPAFWPSSKFSHVVPDYERALIVGSLDLDVQAGKIPISGLGLKDVAGRFSPDTAYQTGNTTATTGRSWTESSGGTQTPMIAQDPNNPGFPGIFAEMGGETVGITLADIDKARTSQAFGKLRTSYAGNDATGFDNDDAIVAELMQGLSVPSDLFKRPWLLDSQRTTFGMIERHATDAANLDESVSTGQASARLAINVPVQDVGGIIIITAEVLPERLYERQGDPFIHIDDVEELPNALRDIQRPEPVDLVANWRVDARHSQMDALYGYEPMNSRWNRDFTRLGGDFYQATPGAPWTEARSAIWQADVVDPTFSEDHYLAPKPFPHDVFADTEADAFEIVFRHDVAIRGLTQIGDVLSENNDDYEAVTADVPKGNVDPEG